MNLNDNIVERIKADADIHKRIYDILLNHNHADRTQATNEIFALFQELNIAGATAENERAQKMADVLDNIGNGPFPITQKELEEWLLKTKAMARKALEQWKGTGKKVEDMKIDYKSHDWEKSKMRPAPQAAIDAMKERWKAEGKRECPDCGLWFKSEGRCPECNPMG